MSFFQPLAALFLPLAGLIILFYLLKIRRQDYEVSSIYLWEAILRDISANAPWQKLRRNLLLFLQILFTLLLIFALMRPFLPVTGKGGHNVIILLDSSVSMAASDVAPTRFEAAKEQVRQIISSIQGSDHLTLIKVTNVAQPLISGSSDQKALRDALDATRTTPAVVNMPDAIALAVSLSSKEPDSQVYVISDGAFSDTGNVTPIAGRLHFIQVGGSGDNQAIIALTVRRNSEQFGQYQVYARVANYAARGSKVLLSFYADRKIFNSRNLTLPPGQAVNVIESDVPLGARTIEARLTPDKDDKLALDDAAWAVTGNQSPTRVLLVGNQTFFLQRILRFLPNLQVSLVKTDDYSTAGKSANDYDVYIFDDFLPQTLPNAPFLVFNPPAGTPLIQEGTSLDKPTLDSWDKADELLRYVDFSEVRIRTAKGLVSPPWAKVVARAGQAPLILHGDFGQRKAVVVGFNLRESNLPLKIAFPIFVANSIGYLSPQPPADLSTSIPAGTILTINPLSQAQDIVVQRPDNQRITIKSTGGPLRYTDTGQLGIYQIVQRANGKEIAQQFFAVNLLSEIASNIAPRAQWQSGSGTIAASPGRVIVNKEIWPWVALLALGLLTVEWWWYHKRG